MDIKDIRQLLTDLDNQDRISRQEHNDLYNFIKSQQEITDKSYLKTIQDTIIKFDELYGIIESLKCCGNCMFDNTDTKNNGGCFGCKQIKDGVKLLHGWEPKEDRMIKEEIYIQTGMGVDGKTTWSSEMLETLIDEWKFIESYLASNASRSDGFWYNKFLNRQNIIILLVEKATNKSWEEIKELNKC